MQFVEAVAVGASEELFALVMLGRAVDGSHRVDDMTGWKVVRRGRFGRTCFTPVERATFFKQLGACSFVDGSINSSPTKKAVIGCVDDGIDGEGGDVAGVDGDEVGEGEDGGGEGGG